MTATDEANRAPLSSGLGSALGAISVVALAAVVRLAGVGQEAIHDELHHVLAASAWLDHGSLALEGGEPYSRAAPLTFAIAGLFSALGESLAVARLPAIAAGSGLAGLLFLWLDGLGERRAAFAVGALVALDPDAIIASQWARFYTLQVFCAAGAVWFALFLVERRRLDARAIAGGMAALGIYLFATYLQITALIGLGGLLLALLVWFLTPLFVADPPSPRRWIVLGGLAAGGITLVALAWLGGVVQHGLRLATSTALWAQGSAGEIRFYYGWLLEKYGVLWPLYPVLLVAAWQRAPLLAIACGGVFGVGLTAHSLMAWKAWRYFEYVMPFFWLPVALGGVVLWDALQTWLRTLAAPLRGGWMRFGVPLVAIAIVGFALVGNRAYLQTARLLANPDPTLSFPGMLRDEGTLSWSRMAEHLAREAAEVDVLVTSDALKALFYLGRADYELNKDHLFDGQDFAPEFTRDPGSGVPVLSTPDGLEAVALCGRTGLLVAEDRLWGRSWSAPVETTRVAEARMERLELPAEWGLRAYRWQMPPAAGLGPCPAAPVADERGDAA